MTSLPGDQHGQLAGDGGLHLLDHLLAVVVEELVNSLGQQLVLPIEQVVHLDEDMADGEVHVEILHLQHLDTCLTGCYIITPLLHLVPLLVGVGEDGGVSGGGHPGHLAGEGAAALQREDEDLAVDPVETRYVHLRYRQPDPEQPDM